MQKKKVVGYLLIALGVFIMFLKPIGGITGMAIGSEIETVASWWFYTLGIAMISAGFFINFYSRLERVGNYYYEPHALDRMKNKWGLSIYPSVVEHVIERGKRYKLTHVGNPEETHGATQVYLKRCAVAKKRGATRSITSQPEKLEWLHLLVLTDNKDVVKTVEVNDNRTLKNFIKNYLR
jgi:hypothetical protein